MCLLTIMHYIFTPVFMMDRTRRLCFYSHKFIAVSVPGSTLRCVLAVFIFVDYIFLLSLSFLAPQSIGHMCNYWATELSSFCILAMYLWCLAR